MKLNSIVLATNNFHKVNEIRSLLPKSYDVKTLNNIGFHQELPETSGTIVGNALQKARFVYQQHPLIVVADDSGLLVESIDNEPGVDSAHYAGFPIDNSKNINKLLQKMIGVSSRKAKFITILAVIVNHKEYLFEGEIEGEIALNPRGDNGFGYDPIFVPTGFDKTFAEMTKDEKSLISHRSIAVDKFVKFLKSEVY